MITYSCILEEMLFSGGSNVRAVRNGYRSLSREEQLEERRRSAATNSSLAAWLGYRPRERINSRSSDNREISLDRSSPTRGYGAMDVESRK